MSFESTPATDLAATLERARQRVERVCVGEDDDAPELVPPERARMVFSGMDVDAVLLNALVDALVLKLLGVMGQTPEADLASALRGAYVEGILFGYEIREGQ